MVVLSLSISFSNPLYDQLNLGWQLWRHQVYSLAAGSGVWVWFMLDCIDIN